ncbi:MAG: hypothetical protein HY833_01890 [Candidatus Aenigmarchaeota archaeon]|nr:hypothetical protein [Candidatus Aenigmarchaeota archaeon]
MKGIIRNIIYGLRNTGLTADKITCPACGCRTIFGEIVENRGVIACQKCVRENA